MSIVTFDRIRRFMVFATPVMGTLQAWDSDVFRAPALVIALVLLGIALLTAVPLLLRRPERAGMALLGGMAIIVIARMLSPISHNELFIIFPIVVMPTLLLLAQQNRTTQGLQ